MMRRQEAGEQRMTQHLDAPTSRKHAEQTLISIPPSARTGAENERPPTHTMAHKMNKPNLPRFGMLHHLINRMIFYMVMCFRDY